MLHGGIVACRGWKGGIGSVLMGIKSVWGDEILLEMGDGDGCTRT